MTPDSASGTADRPLHLLSVWNPSYADDAMDQHLEVLLGWAERRDRGEAEEDDVYVWWGKLRSPRREQELPHRDEVLDLEDQIREGIDTHLYLTDHQSLYGARLVEITGGRRLAERDATLRGDTDRMARELRDNLLGARTWHALKPATRTFLASAEAVFRARRDDPNFDFSGPAVEYAKAVETELNALIFPAVRKALSGQAESDRLLRLGGKPVDVKGPVPHQSLGSLNRLLQHDGTARKGLKRSLGNNAKWLIDELPYQLEPILEMRNPAAHDAASGRERVRHQRSRILGIGCEGMLVRVVKAKE